MASYGFIVVTCAGADAVDIPSICGTPVSLLAHDQRQPATADDLTQRWIRGIGLAAVVGLAYFLTAKFSVRLILESSGVAVFWPAAGISSGLLIALGPRRGRRFPAGHHTGSAESDLKWLLCGD